MNNDSNVPRIPDCKVCYVPHDEEIHEATLRIRRWLNHEVTRKLSTGYETPQEFEDPSPAGHAA